MVNEQRRVKREAERAGAMSEEIGRIETRARMACGKDEATLAAGNVRPAETAASSCGEAFTSRLTGGWQRWFPAADVAERVAHLCIALACWSLLGLSLWLQPAGAGLGTHEQMGFAPCGFHVRYGIPCPTCGMTTSFALLVRGRVWEAFVVQPAGAVLALLTVAAALILPITAWRGRSLHLLLGRLYLPLWLTLLGLLIGLAWTYKIAVETQS